MIDNNVTPGCEGPHLNCFPYKWKTYAEFMEEAGVTWQVVCNYSLSYIICSHHRYVVPRCVFDRLSPEHHANKLPAETDNFDDNP